MPAKTKKQPPMRGRTGRRAAPELCGPYLLRALREYPLIDMHRGDEYLITPGVPEPVTKGGQPVPPYQLVTLMGFVADRQAEIIPAAAKWEAMRVIDTVYDAYLASPEYRALLTRYRAAMKDLMKGEEGEGPARQSARRKS